MANTGKLLLITGPAGSGKSTLAMQLSQELGWQAFSEDDYWVDHDWLGVRTTDQERIVQKEVVRDIVPILKSGGSAILEFILYKKPPNPLTHYQDVMREKDVSFDTIVLKPSLDAVMSQIVRRRRKNDMADLEGRRADAQNQLAVLENDFIDPTWVINPESRRPDQLAQLCIEKLSLVKS